MIEKIISSPYLYPIWRISWLEKSFFRLCRALDRPKAKAFLDIYKGHDVSWYQGYIDFTAMLASGAKFCIPRLGYGVTKDVRFDEYMAGVNGILPNNPYHFYHPELSPVAQADKVLAILYPYQQRISRVWLDMEYEWGGAYTDSKHWKTYRDGINTVYPTGIYTRATWWDSRVGTLAAEFGRDPFWVAQYSSALTLIPKGAKDVLIWQSGSPTYYAGQSSPRIDYDLWNTDYNFDAEWNGAIVTPPPTGETMLYGKVNTAVLNIRNAGAATGLDIGDLKQNDYIVAYRSVGGWWELKEAYRGGWTGAPVALANGTLVNNTVTPMWAKDSYIVVVPAPVVAPSPPPPATNPDVKITIDLGAAYPVTVVNIKPL